MKEQREDAARRTFSTIICHRNTEYFAKKHALYEFVKIAPRETIVIQVCWEEEGKSKSENLLITQKAATKVFGHRNSMRQRLERKRYKNEVLQYWSQLRALAELQIKEALKTSSVANRKIYRVN